MPVYNQPKPPRRTPRTPVETPQHIKDAESLRNEKNREEIRKRLAGDIKALQDYAKQPFRMSLADFYKYVPLFQKDNRHEITAAQLHYLREEYYRTVGPHRNVEIFDHTDIQKRTLFVIGKALSTLKLMPHGKDSDLLRSVNFKRENFDPGDIMVARVDKAYTAGVVELKNASADQIATDIVTTHQLNKQIKQLREGGQINTLAGAGNSPVVSTKSEPVNYSVGIGEIEE